jgi:hypothetical protein
LGDETKPKGFEIDFSEIKLLSQIAQGPFAVVHSAIYRGAQVAVKVCIPSFSLSAQLMY